MSDNTSPAWLSLKEAAAAFGVSVKTLRRRIGDGKLTAQKDESNPQARWTIREDSLTKLYGQHRGAPPAEHRTPPVAIELKELLDDQRRLISEVQRSNAAEAIASAKAEHLAERVTEYREERDHLKAERDHLGERVVEYRVEQDQLRTEGEHLGERVTEYRTERDHLRAEHDRLIRENAALRHRRWWRKRPPEHPMDTVYPMDTPT